MDNKLNLLGVTDDTPSTITVYSSSKINLLLSDKEKKSSYDVRDYGAKGDGITDDTLSIENAINSAFMNGGGTVYFHSNTYIASSIILKEKVRLLGDGESSVIVMKNDTNDNFIKVFDEYTGWCGLESLKIDGNKTNNTKGHAVYFARAVYGDDSHLFLKNIHITEAPEDGFRVYGGQHREGRYINVTIDYCGGFGFYHDGSDNNMICITSWRNGLAGFYENGSANRWLSCKTFQCNTINRSSHDSAGWLIYNGQRNTFTDCQAQESYGHGWYLEVCRDMTLQGCVADSNGITSLNQQTTSDLTKNGFDINVCSNVVLNSCMCTDFRQDDSGKYKTQNIGVHLNYCTDCIINITCSKQQIDVKDDHDEGVYENLKIINGIPIEYLKIGGTIAQRLEGTEDAMIEIHRDNLKNWVYGQNGLDKSFRIDRYDPDTESWQDSPINLPISGGAVLGGLLLKDNSIVNATNINTPVSIGGVMIVTKAAIPTTGTWTKGALVYNSNPKANGYIGWVCITTGTPGIWKGFGLIQN
ncbi:glycosyl hydrolase family 28-related protein [Clostridium tagluense]|uniref:glycosyl hydrolase family 28-related protein n=1 Tax=Clostridium tagluense TaxID=360422 RepID=UPI001CF24895|nr:glycosyl hydrolase family 28-related protein [Clostridium tagluense]MCB2298280.1 glycoside hydrolase family 55 protein [Clostridium tagluense]